MPLVHGWGGLPQRSKGDGRGLVAALACMLAAAFATCKPQVAPALHCLRHNATPALPLAEAFVEWSPRGSMLATVHRQGVALWGGKSFERLQRVG